jgi:hypothetical protein
MQEFDAILREFGEQVHKEALHLYGPPTAADRCAVFSIRIDGYDDPADHWEFLGHSPIDSLAFEDANACTWGKTTTEAPTRE